MCHFILANRKFCVITNSNHIITKNKLCHFILEKNKIYDITNNIIYKYMTWYKQISVKEYEDLIKIKIKFIILHPILVGQNY